MELVNIKYFEYSGWLSFHPNINMKTRLTEKSPMVRISRLSHEPDRLFKALGALTGLPRCRNELIVAMPINMSASKTGFLKPRSVSKTRLRSLVITTGNVNHRTMPTLHCARVVNHTSDQSRLDNLHLLDIADPDVLITRVLMCLDTDRRFGDRRVGQGIDMIRWTILIE